jgi:hypothetical protein
MKDPNGFDELARRKLAERDFAFDPSHWTDMEQLLFERDRKPMGWWPWMAAGVLLLGGAAVWSVLSDEAASLPGAKGPVIERVERLKTITEPVTMVEAATPSEASRAVAEQAEEHTASPVTGTEAPEGQTAGVRTSTARWSSPARTLKTGETADPVHDENEAPASSSAGDGGENLTTTATLTGSTLVADVPTAHAAEEGNGTKEATIDPPASAIATVASSEGTGTASTEVAEPVAPTMDPGQQTATVVVQEPLENTAPAPSERIRARQERRPLHQASLNRAQHLQLRQRGSPYERRSNSLFWEARSPPRATIAGAEQRPGARALNARIRQASASKAFGISAHTSGWASARITAATGNACSRRNSTGPTAR